MNKPFTNILFRYLQGLSTDLSWVEDATTKQEIIAAWQRYTEEPQDDNLLEIGNLINKAHRDYIQALRKQYHDN